jgi:hypothetical protein
VFKLGTCFKPKVTPDFEKSDFCHFYSPSKLGSGGVPVQAVRQKKCFWVVSSQARAF